MSTGSSSKSGGGGGASRGGHVRVKTARKRTPQSVAWLSRQLNDPYVAAAKAQGYRARSSFKLIELDDQFAILKNASAIVDLGAAPGGWCQVALERRPKARIAAIDLLPIEPMAHVDFFQMDFLTDEAQQKLITSLGGLADVVLSDMAANTTGHKQTDHLRTMGLCEAALDFAVEVLKPGGNFVAKVFAGGADTTLLARMKQRFAIVKHAKPPASRKGSSEWYVVAQGFKGKIDDINTDQ
jgi:23S rRNA (uridine2552-2'-O)-methyltransferase